MKSAACDAILRQRGSLTVWFTEETATAWKEADDASQVGPLLGQVAASTASFTVDRTCNQDDVYAAAKHHPDAAIIVPPRSTALLSETGDRGGRRWPRSEPHAGP